jgi:type II restriction/modification system DNA methylase subunit YeeA
MVCNRTSKDICVNFRHFHSIMVANSLIRMRKVISLQESSLFFLTAKVHNRKLIVSYVLRYESLDLARILDKEFP